MATPQDALAPLFDPPRVPASSSPASSSPARRRTRGGISHLFDTPAPAAAAAPAHPHGAFDSLTEGR
jgi:hypothetical protein